MSARGWTDIGSDVNWREHGGLWARRIEGTETLYSVVRFCNSADWGAIGYHCDLLEVDLESPQLDAARESCGYAADWCDEYGEPLSDWCKVAALAGYGGYDLICQETSRNAHALLRAIKRRAS